MRNPNDVLNSLQSKTSVNGYQFERLYRNLYNPNFYLLAYQNIYANKGSMTEGIDGTTIDGMGLERISEIIEKMKDFSYQPNPVKRQYIPKANGKLRPLGIPSANDKLIQEVVRLLLESIYEPTFLNESHGFRHNRSCHTALMQIKNTYTGIKWFVEGDITGCFDNIDHHTLINILRRKIKDEQFIALIWKFLRAGYMDNWKYFETYSGSAQGSIMSPLLANIYMNELDSFMTDYKLKFDKGMKRSSCKEYSRRKSAWNVMKKSIEKNWDNLTEDEKKESRRCIESQRKTWDTLPAMEPMDENYRRIVYCRYADDWLCGIIGSKADAEQVKEDIKSFLRNSLKLELSESKTLITHATNKARFLGYDITLTEGNGSYAYYKGVRYRRPSGRVKLYVPKEKWVKSLLEKNILDIRKDATGKEFWMPIARGKFVNKPPIEIISTYNAEIRGLYNYYSLASNVSVLNKYYYVMKYSLYKTFAKKYRCSMIKIKKKYSKNNIFSIPYATVKGEIKQVSFYHGGFRMKLPSKDSSLDVKAKPVTFYNPPKELIVRLLGGRCEACGKQEDILKVYHVKKLKDLDSSSKYESIMLRKHRKSLVVCNECFEIIHKIKQTDV